MPASRSTNGDKARVYANDFIGIHLTKVPNSRTIAVVFRTDRRHPRSCALSC